MRRDSHRGVNTHRIFLLGSGKNADDDTTEMSGRGKQIEATNCGSGDLGRSIRVERTGVLWAWWGLPSGGAQRVSRKPAQSNAEQIFRQPADAGVLGRSSV